MIIDIITIHATPRAVEFIDLDQATYFNRNFIFERCALLFFVKIRNTSDVGLERGEFILTNVMRVSVYRCEIVFK